MCGANIMNAGTAYPLTSLGFWRGYWTTARPYLFFVSGSAGLVGIALEPEPALPAAVAAFTVAFLSYGLGQALTDVFQTDTDALSSPYRPLVRGEIARRHVLEVSLVGLGICATILAIIRPATLLLAALAVAGLATYTPMKRRPWCGPPWNSWIVALLPAIGALSISDGVTAAWHGGRLGWAMASAFFTYAIFVILGYLKDVEADRATGYRTLCVVFGRKAAVAASACCLVLGSMASVMLVRKSVDPGSALAILLWSIGIVILVRAHLRGWRVTTDAKAHPAVADSVRGFVLLHLGEAALLQANLIPISLLLWFAFETALASRPARSQI